MKDIKTTTYNASLVRSLEATIRRAHRRVHVLLDQSARRTCPVKAGELFRARDPQTGRPGYFLAVHVRGERRGSLIEYSIQARNAVKSGEKRPGVKYSIGPSWGVEKVKPDAGSAAIQAMLAQGCLGVPASTQGGRRG